MASTFNNQGPPSVGFMLDKQELKPGLVIFRRSDVKHNNWYCRIKVPEEDRYKTIALKTSDVIDARTKAYKEDVSLHIKIEHKIPLFDKPFRAVAEEYRELQEKRNKVGEITDQRLATVTSYIVQLNRYCGNDQISHIGESRWTGYPLWRRSTGTGRAKGTKVSDWTIRGEMNVKRSIMTFAAKKGYVAKKLEVDMRGLKLGKPRGEEFTPEEYRKLYTHARDKWIPKAKNRMTRWYREVFYNFMLVMANTGVRPPEAGNWLRRDRGDPRAASDGRPYLPLRVRGKDKYRELVAPMSVATYLDRIYKLMDQRLKELGKTATPDTHIFLNWDGEAATTLYQSLLNDLLSEKETNLLYSAGRKRRSTYSFRHTYATFRILKGTHTFKLALQMGTSEDEIRETYAHVTPSSNADVILQGIPAWEEADDGSSERAFGVNADAAGAKAKPKAAKRKRKALPTAGKASRSTRRR